MRTFYGTVMQLLRDANDRVCGFVLDSGEAIHFSIDHLDLVPALLTLNSRIQITGDLRCDRNGQQLLTSAHFTNLDSNRSTSLPAPVRLSKTGMLLSATPNTTASLAFHPISEPVPPSETGLETHSPPEILDRFLEEVAIQARQLRPASTEHPHQHSQPLLRATRSDAASAIERAYDSLVRIQAVLAYLNIMKRQVHGMSQMHEEARHTYEQALSRHAIQDFAGAFEFGTTSECLSRVVEGVISRALRSDTSYPSLVPPPPVHMGTCESPGRVQDELDAVEAVLARVHWLLENGTLPLEERTQVRRIAGWGDAFYQQARRMYQRGAHRDATELVQAGIDVAAAAEHVCRNWYVVHADSQHHTFAASLIRHSR
jgi:hypothetical protein